MILHNSWTFGGEVVRMKDFGDGKGGNIVVKGASPKGDVEVSIRLSEELYKCVCDKKYPKVIARGHLEWRTWETAGFNVKHSLLHVADEFEWVS